MKNIFKREEENENKVSRNIPVRNNGLKLDKAYFQWGLKEASYIAGFATAFTPLELSEENMTVIIVNKVNLEYQKEMLRMKLESDENIASKYAKVAQFIDRDDE